MTEVNGLEKPRYKNWIPFKLVAAVLLGALALLLIARLLVENPDEAAARLSAERLYDVVRTYLLSHPAQKKRVLMLRVDEAPVRRIRGQYRCHVLLKAFDHPEVSPLLRLLSELAGVEDGASKIYCEVNPATMM